LYERYQAPVMDWYSTTETGPIAAADPQGLRLIAPDLYVEIVDPEGRPLPDGERGEIVVSGGRNPYLTLIRYRTGDYAIKSENRLIDLEGRTPVSWRAGDGTVVTPVDLARVLNRHVWSTFGFREEEGSLILRIRPVPGYPLDIPGLKTGMEQVLRRKVAVQVAPDLGGNGKKEKPWS
jgi:phenylacetate-CoA ligase